MKGQTERLLAYLELSDGKLIADCPVGNETLRDFEAALAAAKKKAAAEYAKFEKRQQRQLAKAYRE